MVSGTDEILGVEKRVSQLTWLIGIITAIQVAGVPWAYHLQSDVAVTRTKLEALEKMEVPPAWFKQDVHNNEADIRDNTRLILSLQERVTKLESRTQ
jgi:hypothetical protein